MFGYWLNSRARQTSALLGAASLSVLFHGSFISAWVFVTMPRGGAGFGADSLSNKPPVYIPPPDRSAAGRGTTPVAEHVSYLAIARPGAQTFGDNLSKPKPAEKPKEIVIPDSQPLLAQSAEPPPSQDSVFTEVEVDTPVRLTSSAAPDYPADLLKENIEGRVVARWVIDTLGRADTASFELVQATRPEFAAALKAVLPRMKFQPARIGHTPVRQLVEQSIAFKIQTPTAIPAKVTGPQKPAPSPR